jgi:curved DNA-binding protein CbpA
MVVLNRAVEVLSDPEKRRQHDEWIAQQEQEQAQSNGDSDNSDGDVEGNPEREVGKKKESSDWAHTLQLLLIPLTAFGLFLVTKVDMHTQREGPGSQAHFDPEVSTASSRLGSRSPQEVVAAADASTNTVRPIAPPEPARKSEPWHDDLAERQAPPDAPSTRSTKLSTKSAPAGRNGNRYVRLEVDPNGNRWPTSSSYLVGTRIGRDSGRSSISIDNSQNDSDVFLKLVWHGPDKHIAVRLMFIKGGDVFKLEAIERGEYDLRYQDLDSGAMNRSRNFTLEEIEETDGIRYSTVTITLYKVRGGNSPMHEIPEEDFLVAELQ